MRSVLLHGLASLVLAAPTFAAGEIPLGAPAATVDLATRGGLALVKGEWRYADARPVEVDFRSAGPDRKPSGPPNRTWDVEPHAGALDFDDSGWEVVDPTSLAERRSSGKVCFAWYRLDLTIPERVGDVEVAGTTVVFEVVVDDHAEVWVDGKLPRELGQVGGSMIAGWNAPNRVVVASDAQPGQRVQVAVFGVNGPISDAPANYIWVRSSKLDFHRVPHAVTPVEVPVNVVRLDAAIDAIVPAASRLEKLATGFQFTEGPIWHPDGYLLFSDPNANTIYKWSDGAPLSVFRAQSGYSGADVALYRQPGSNGLTLDAEGRLTTCEHGNRRVTRTEADGSVTVLADRFDGRRLNSPNDLVYRSDGTLFFTDPPFGLPMVHDDPRRELPFTGVYSLSRGKLQLVSRELHGPNGLAFSPDEKWLYVANWDEKRKVVVRHEVRPDATLGAGTVLFDMGGAPGEEALDGLKVDRQGHLYVSGPGGVWVLSAEGKHLGTIQGPELPANFAWGEDGRTLYMTARTGLYRMRVNVAGAPPR